MEKKIFYLFGFLLLLTTLSESRVIVPRAIQNFANSGNGEIPYSLNPLGNANKPAFSPEISNKPTSGDDFGVYDYGVQPFDYDYEVPGKVDEKDVDDGSKVNSEKFPSDVDRTEGPLTGTDEKDDGNFHKNPDTDKFGDDSKDSEIDSKPKKDEDKWIPKDEDEFPIDNDIDEKSEEDDSVKKQHGNGEEDNKHTPEDEKDRVPGVDEDKDDSKDDEESREHDKDGEESKEHDKDGEESKEHDKDGEESKEHDMDGEESKEHDMDGEESKEHDKDEEESKEHDKDEEESKEHDEEDEESNKHDKDDEEFDEHDNDDEEPKAHKDDEGSEEPDEEDDDKDIHAAEDAEPFSGGSFFDTPFFNYERVKNYFGLLDRALGHVFRETMDEAKLLNGTYANTTEEEVDIDGKKYVVQKSVIKSADNHSTIYVETLSTRPKVNNTEEIKDMEMQNVTHV